MFLSTEYALVSVTGLTVTGNGYVHIADEGQLRVLSAVPYIPQPDEQIEFHISSPADNEIYVFNKYGQHIGTRSKVTGRPIYTFMYSVPTSFGKLITVQDSTGNKISLFRDKGHHLHTLENAEGQKCITGVNKHGLLESFTDPTGYMVKFGYDGNGLLIYKADSAGETDRKSVV